ncbi:MAG: YccF domain-containing protein [Tissierellia bacterium]|nr:YccF domain-containing protein [Tissierellia bacterium]
MKALGNILWFLFGGLWAYLAWCLIGILWSITIIGIPIGKQCFKIASLSLFPFGKRIETNHNNLSLIVNILWIIFGGIELAITHLIIGVVLVLTIIGAPFGRQHFKLARLSLAPFGVEIH